MALLSLHVLMFGFTEACHHSLSHLRRSTTTCFALWAIIFCIISAIVRDIILGIAFVASATTSPPVIAPRTAASIYPLVESSH